MRLLGTLKPDAARRFTAAVRARGLEMTLRPQPDGTLGLWIHDEDQLTAAREELDAFERDPQSVRFDLPPSEPPPSEAGNAPAARSRAVERPSAWRRLPVTCTLIAVSVVASVLDWSGTDFGRELAGNFYIAPVEVHGDKLAWIPALGLSAVASGEVWRLVTPIFLHGGPLHLLFNMSALWLLGGAVETVRGTWRMLVFVLFAAIASNLAEYYCDFGFEFNTEKGLDLSGIRYDPNPMFLGMSGVVFALFGLVWIRSRLVPRSGFLMPRDMVVWMLIWLLVCTSGLIGPIANVAHGVGLFTGMLCGALPRLWMRT